MHPWRFGRPCRFGRRRRSARLRPPPPFAPQCWRNAGSGCGSRPLIPTSSRCRVIEYASRFSHRSPSDGGMSARQSYRGFECALATWTPVLPYQSCAAPPAPCLRALRPPAPPLVPGPIPNIRGGAWTAQGSAVAKFKRAFSPTVKQPSRLSNVPSLRSCPGGQQSRQSPALLRFQTRLSD
jgi:hypothetical protein